MMRSLEDAQNILSKAALRLFSFPPNIELIPLWEAGGRVLAKEIKSREDVPAFDRSLVDGFALLASDTARATADYPVTLKIVDSIAAGTCSSKKLIPGTAMKIFTGAPLPEGADSVIKKEEVVEAVFGSGNDAVIMVNSAVAKGEGTALRGEDIVAGECMFAEGTVLTSAHMGVLATLGVEPVPVYTRPQVGVFSTGNELVDVRSQLKTGQLRVSNIYTLAEIIRQAGGIPVNLGVVKDRVESVLEVYAKTRRLGLPMVVSTGGTASGDYDVIKTAMDMVAVRLFNKVAIRPGAPAVVSVREGEQLLIGLSGNPAGATVAMLLLIYPLIARLAGANRQLECVQGKLTKPLFRQGGVRGFLWANYCHQKAEVYVTPFENQYCGSIKTYANSNCLIEIPAGKVNLAANEPVTIWKLPE
ncbi:MAG TPA: molybdopterin molybdotransferase MoeA [Firmicutes bacterium]|nr:molybdopterin molybdotransferase MoeA [Bacillota bacterium]